MNSLGLFLSCRPSKVIELNFKPFVNFLVDLEVLVTDLLWCEAFFQRLETKSTN